MNKKQFEVLTWASSFLEAHESEPGIAEILLLHHLGVTRSQFFMDMQETIEPEIIQSFVADIKQHTETGVPVQHLTGYEYFYGRKFAVNKHTLIPRPETEELIEYVINNVDKERTKRLTIADIGTGSGVIATTLALEIDNVHIYGTDISANALIIAKKNAENLGVKVTFLRGDFLKPLIDQGVEVDILISNPPYIALSDESTLSRTVKNFDPRLALFAESDGLAAYEQILKLSTKVLRKNGLIVFEIGYRQGVAVSQLIKTIYPNSEVAVIKDINGNDRIVTAKMNKTITKY